MKTLLVVDDNKCIRDLMNLALSSLPGCRILSAENGAEAVKVFEVARVDAVLTDLSMPVMDGYQLTRHIRSIVPDMPVIVMSSEAGPHIDARLKPLAVAHFFEKPFDLTNVAREIASVLGLVRNPTLPAPPVRAAFFNRSEHAIVI